MGTLARSRGGKAPIRNFERDHSPVPDLAKYEWPQTDDEYRHRMIINAIALVFTSLLILAGLWLANNMIVHA
jgi:hypothetical protein